MSDSRPVVLVYYPRRGEEYRSLLLERDPTLSLRVCETVEDVKAQIGQIDVLFTSVTLPPSLIHLGKRLRWVQAIGAGVDSFIYKTSFPKGILLSRVTVSFGERIAEYVMGYILYVAQHIGEVVSNQTLRRWKAPESGVSLLNGKVLGIMGVGAVGGTVARAADGFGMDVIGLDVLPRELPTVRKTYSLDGLSEFLSQVHYLVICLPLTRQTEGMLGREQFAAMRGDAYVVNVARGAIIKEKELIRALEEGRIRGAILDVFEEEPLPSASPLWTMKSVVVSPHIAGGASPKEMVDFFVANLERFRRGEPLQGVVDLERGF
jgi:phosphoglycerate dehydrogenase-like enzyme